MKSTVAPLAALVAYAAAQQGYGYSAPSYESSSSVSAPSYSNATMTTSSAAPSGTGSSGDCYSKYNDCRVAPDANMAYCASQYASCLGYNPFAGNGTNTVTPAPSDVYVTAVVTSFTTVCPNPTTVTVPCGEGPPQTYTISSSTTLTVTKCPGGCHVPTPVASMPPAQTITAIVSSYTTYCPQPTTITYGPSTSQITTTVSQPTTITIATCPGGCTVTAPVSAITPPAYQPSSPASSSVSVSPVAPSNGTTPSSPTGITPYTGAAEKVMAGGSLMAAAAAAVLFL